MDQHEYFHYSLFKAAEDRDNFQDVFGYLC